MLNNGRLEAILAPILMVSGTTSHIGDKPRTSLTDTDPHPQIDYTQVSNHRWPTMPRDDFINAMRHRGLVGDMCIRTQHHIGASKWEKQSNDYIIGHHQLRAAHQRYSATDMRTIESEGNGHSMVTMFYGRLDGEWKIVGLKPTVRLIDSRRV